MKAWILNRFGWRRCEGCGAWGRGYLSDYCDNCGFWRAVAVRAKLARVKGAAA